MIEHERRFLPHFLPKDLASSFSREIIDIYIPKSSSHAALRIRKNGEQYFMTKKYLVNEEKTICKEETIHLSEEEFEVLRQLEGKVLHKIRYDYEHQGQLYEIGVFQGPLKGLVIIDAEFEDEESMKNFVKPDFCGAEVNEEHFAGGWLCGKTLDEVKDFIAEKGHQPIFE